MLTGITSIVHHHKEDACSSSAVSLLSPNLKSFLDVNDDHHHKSNHTPTNDATNGTATNDTKNGNGGNGERKKKVNLVLSPAISQCDQSTDDEGSATLLHSIFSPKFQARSAKKKLRQNMHHHHHHHHPHHHQSHDGYPAFSPLSTTSTRCDASAVSDMSDDDFGTINAILRGDTIENIKRHVGLDRDHHPLSVNRSASGSKSGGTGFAKNEDAIAPSGNDASVDEGASSNAPPPAAGEGEAVDDSTEVMLEKARALSSKRMPNNARGETPADVVHLDQQTFTPPPSNQNNAPPQRPTDSQTTKTPKATPTSNEDFYTPNSSANPTDNDVASRSSPTTLDFDVAGHMSGGKALPPVWEEEEIRIDTTRATGAGGSDYWDPYAKDGSAGEDDVVLMTDFRTPKQHDGKYWKMDDFSKSSYGDDDDDDDEEEFFSPLVHHADHTPSSKEHDLTNGNNDNDNISLLSALDFKADSSISNAHSFEQLSVSQSVVPCTNVPVAAAAPDKNGSPNIYSEGPKRESLSREDDEGSAALATPQDAHSQAAAGAAPQPTLFGSRTAANCNSAATPPSKASFLAHHHAGVIPQSPILHLHSPSVSSLPPEALTVDFVKQCDCIDTLEAILCLLSDDTNVQKNTTHRRGNHLVGRYPKLALLVEKRLQKMRAGMEEFVEGEKEEAKVDKEQSVQLPPKVGMAGDSKMGEAPSSSAGAGDKGSVTPLLQQNEHSFVDEFPREIPRPMESITLLHEEGAVKHDGIANPSVSPEFSATLSQHSSLDMNLSQSLFALDDESYFWKQGLDNGVDDGNNKEGEEDKQRSEKQRCLIAEETFVENTNNSQHKASQTNVTVIDDIHQRCEELKEKLASTLTDNARLTGEVDSLVSKHHAATLELSSQLQDVTEQLSQLKVTATTEKNAQQNYIVELESINADLREQVRLLHEQLHRLNEKSEGTTRQMQSELKEARMHHSTLSKDKETLGQELNEVRSSYGQAQRDVAKLKLLLDKKNVTPDSKSAHKLQRVVESSKLANQALANALAVSEKDLAEANEEKEKRARECNALRTRATKLEDKSAFLSSKVKCVSKELESSRVYIDQLYADLQTKNKCGRSPSKEMRADFERKELEWMELERGYSKRIQELEGQLDGPPNSSKHGVSMDAYLLEVKQTRHYKMESTRNAQTVEKLNATVSDLREQLNAMQRFSVKKSDGGGKSFRALQSIELKQVALSKGNNENAAPSNARDQQYSASDQIDLGASKQQQQQRGKQLSRVAAIKAAGGRKGLTEQLKRTRRFGESKAHSGTDQM